MRCVGYRQVWDYLAGNLSDENLPEKAIIATRQLAKRQMTWLRTQIDAHWFDSLNPNLTPQVLKLLEKTINLKTVHGYTTNG
jgi:tRNA dimethylallyltransferase